MGGLSEKAVKLHTIVSNTNGNLVTVDSGNLLYARNGQFEPDSAEAVRARAVGEVYTRLGYDAVGIGTRDLSAGLDILYHTRDQGLKWTSANLYEAGGDRPFEPYQLKKVGGINIAMVGITGPGSTRLDGYRITNPAQELALLLPSLEDRVDLILLLSTLPQQENMALARQFSQIDIIIAADLSTGNLKPVQAGAALVTQTTNRGQYLGVLRVGCNDGPWEVPPAEQLSRLTNRLTNLHLRISRQQSSNKAPGVSDEALKKLESQRDQLQLKIDELGQQVEFPNEGETGKTYRCDFLKITQTGRGDAQIEAIIEQARRNIKALQKK